MTVQTNTSVASFAGNGTTSVFPIGFKFNSAADLVVTLIDDASGSSLPLTLNSQYTVSGAGNEGGGTVTLITAPATGQTLKVKRVVDLLQLTDLRNQGSFFAEVHEDAFDLLTMFAQQNAADIGAAILVAETDPQPARLAPAQSRANQLLGFDSKGNPVAVSPASGSTEDLALNLVNESDPNKGAGQVGYKGRNVHERLSDVLSVKDYGAAGDGVTSDQASLAAAVAAAVAAGADLYWPAGNYLSTGSIANFHAVRHVGPGLLLRGSTTWRITPSETVGNVVYVGATGSDANDGITAAQPVATIQRAFDILEHYAPLSGAWAVELAAGTYTQRGKLAEHVSFNDSYLEIRGPAKANFASTLGVNPFSTTSGAKVVTVTHVGHGGATGDDVFISGAAAVGGITLDGFYSIVVVDANSYTITHNVSASSTTTGGGASVAVTLRQRPSAYIDYDGAGLIGIDLGQGNRCKVRDIGFLNWKGSAITGLNAGEGCVLWAQNVHARDCRQAIVADAMCRLYVTGGKLSGIAWSTGSFPPGGGQVGIVVYAGSVASIGYNATSLATGTIIENFSQAGYEGKAHTHCVSSYCTFRSNELAVWAYSNARFDERSNDYRKNGLVHKLQKGFLSKDLSLPSDYHFADTYAQAPGDAGFGNAEFYRFLQHSAEDATLYGSAPLGALDICHQRITTQQTGAIAATKARDLATIYAGMLTNSPAGKYFEVFMCGATTGAGGTKTVTLRLGSTVLSTLTVASGAQSWTARVEVWASNSTSQIVITTATGATVAAVRSVATTTMTADQVLSVWQEIPGAADTASLHEARVVFWG